MVFFRQQAKRTLCECVACGHFSSQSLSGSCSVRLGPAAKAFLLPSMREMVWEIAGDENGIAVQRNSNWLKIPGI